MRIFNKNSKCYHLTALRLHTEKENNHTIAIFQYVGGEGMATNKRVFTLRLSDEVFDKIGVLATNEHRSITNYIEFVLLKHLEEVEKAQGKIQTDETGVETQ